jgi:glycosyltransferase involved in cell wall biosynthesis
MIARMNDRVKNHALFLRAAAGLARKFPSVESVLVGDGPLRPGLERMAAQLGLGQRAIFLGERHDIPQVLAAMDISVVASLSESLSNVILESMAAGVPVVATHVGGNPELVHDGDTGLLVSPGHEGELVVALERLLEQPSLRVELGTRGREFARANFSLDQMRERYEQLYISLLREKGWLPKRQHLGESPAADLRRPLKLVLVAASPRWVGGQSVQAQLLIRCWQNDAAVDASFIPIDPMLPRPLKWVERIPYLRTIVREPFYLARLWNGTRNADIVHVFSASYWAFLLTVVPAWLTSRVRGKKILVNYHSAEARDHLRRWLTARLILRRADRVVVPSQYLVDVFREFGVAAQAVPNIVDLDQFRFRVRNPLRPRLVNTRGFDPYYSVDLVVRAFAQVRKEFSGAHLCLAGEGNLEGKIRVLARDLQVDDIEFTGPISHKMIARYYDQADIFVNASWLDNMPISILEAFASGTPVVTTAPEGIRYLVEHERTGLLCQPSDWKALAANVIRLLHDASLASRLARNAYEESRKYCWEAVRTEWLRLYDSLLVSSTE